MEENKNEKRKILPKRKNYVFVSFFLEEKIAKENISTQEFFLQRLAKNGE